jgi:hypothetical protein
MNLNAKELSSLLQVVIDAPALQPYFHPEQPGRTPLVVITRLPGEVELRKFGQDVRVTSQASAGQPALEITDVTPTSSGWNVAFQYDAEGINGKFDVGRDAAGQWMVQKHELHER